MEESEIREYVAKFDTVNFDEGAKVWTVLKPLGYKVLPYFIEYYPKMKKWQGRVALIYHSIYFAREHELAFQLGLNALEDRATLVRYRACMLLAYSLRQDAIKPLKKLLKHKDTKTIDDAKAAIDAIKRKNHNYFWDRNHTGQIKMIIS